MKNRPEEALQKAVCRFLNVSTTDLYYYHVPNQRGTRAGWEQGLLTGMGMQKGVADLCLVLPGGRAAFIELKSQGGRLSGEQMIFRNKVQFAGALYAQCRSLEEVEAALIGWGVELRGRLT